MSRHAYALNLNSPRFCCPTLAIPALGGAALQSLAVRDFPTFRCRKKPPLPPPIPIVAALSNTLVTIRTPKLNSMSAKEPASSISSSKSRALSSLFYTSIAPQINDHLYLDGISQNLSLLLHYPPLCIIPALALFPSAPQMPPLPHAFASHGASLVIGTRWASPLGHLFAKWPCGTDHDSSKKGRAGL